VVRVCRGPLEVGLVLEHGKVIVEIYYQTTTGEVVAHSVMICKERRLTTVL
jgi:hypothetical protein